MCSGVRALRVREEPPWGHRDKAFLCSVQFRGEWLGFKNPSLLSQELHTELARNAAEQPFRREPVMTYLAGPVF